MMYTAQRHAGFIWTHATLIAFAAAALVLALAFLSQMPTVLK